MEGAVGTACRVVARRAPRVLLSAAFAVGLPAFVSAFVACAHDERHLAVAKSPAARSSTGPSAFRQYVIADPSTARPAGSILRLGGEAFGLTFDHVRVIIGRGEPRVAPDAPPDALTAGFAIPSRAGGGYLFATNMTLYRADTFDGPLRPLAKVPDTILSLSMGPKFALVRTQNGERWSLALPSGDRARLDPLGVADVEGLDDGRALALTDSGGAFASLDGGEHWLDLTAQLRSSPSRVRNLDGELFLVQASGAHRLEHDGRLSWFDSVGDDKPIEIRPKDPRWRGTESPLHAAFQTGVALDDGSALVLEGGDLVRVDIHSGELLSVVSGRLPADASCEGMSVPGDVLFVCSSSAPRSDTSFVVAHTLGDSPVIEQTFDGNGQFFASDDGGLAYDGSCQGSGPGSGEVACVRQPGGSWEEQETSRGGDGGIPSSGSVVRWIPRADGRVAALMLDPTPTLFEPRTGVRRDLPPEVKDFWTSTPSFGRKKSIRHRGPSIIDGSWSFVGTSLRGWQFRTTSVEISEEGRILRSPFGFQHVAEAGAYALGRTADGRLFQTSDHGASWLEVAPPPGGSAAGEVRSCTTAGCDLGAFYRVGWATVPAPPPSESRTVPPAPEVRRSRGLVLACRPTGTLQSKVLPTTTDSPEDFGLGNVRLPVATEKAEWAYFRYAVARGIVNPIHEPSSSDSDGQSVRALFSGFQTSREGEGIVVQGPNKNPAALKRALAYVPPFDPSGRVLRPTIAMSDVLAAGRAAGMSNDEVFEEDVIENASVLPITPHDPNVASDVLVQGTRGLYVATRGERTRTAFHVSAADGRAISAVALGADETAVLEVDGATGVEHVFKITASGLVDLFDVNATVSETSMYPANPDALAISSKGDLVVLRVPSGSEPSSELDPAYVITPGAGQKALAPWSTLRFAEDPACKSEPGGYRATIQLVAPWLRLASADLRGEDSPSIVRVRWTEQRVCLEGFEVRGSDVTVRRASASTPGNVTANAGTWIVGRGNVSARVAIGAGFEWRQPFECSLPAP